eukprot:13517929-Alexandrium_andersonii.AAC.1
MANRMARRAKDFAGVAATTATPAVTSTPVGKDTSSSTREFGKAKPNWATGARDLVARSHLALAQRSHRSV